MNSTHSLSIVVLLLLLTASADAQVAHGGQPESLLQPFSTTAPFLSVPAPDVARYMAEDEAREHRPLRYGAVLPLEVGIADGAWTTLPGKARVWRLQIAAPGALSLAVEFSRFELSPGAKLFVWDEKVVTVLGAYTAENRHADGGFVFEPFPGDELTLEVSVPIGAPDPVLATRALIYDYRGVLALTSTTGGGSQANCLIDVNCPEGVGRGNQKRATLRTESGGMLCSAVLLNNTAADGTGYVLTANHCGQTSATIFMFRNEVPGCGTGTAPINMTVSGCTVLATNVNEDNRLLRIGSAIPAGYEPFYAGWTRSTQNATFAFTMGHPNGGPKKISIDSNGTAMVLQYWTALWSQGVLQVGSSGGPLFDENGRVKGQQCCVDNFTCGSQTAYFGQFHPFWNAGVIAAFLDPLSQNPLWIDGFDPLLVPATAYCFGDGSATACPCGNFSTTGNMEGCLNPLGHGGKLVAMGSNSVGSDTLELHGSLMPNGTALYYQGTTQTNGGSGAVFGDGLRCASGAVIRLGLRSNSGGASRYPAPGDVPISVKGLVVAGDARTYQCWYRQAQAFCTSATFNLTNGLSIVWGP